ncbi:MAG TPA: bacteriohemerythrin [Deltaproteobacteria bacterium]|nr:bacteriohemerythrin [Deltaproteobacteria bacterium]
MAYIQWRDDLSVKVREFDEQHKKLIALINELHDAMAGGKGREVVGKVLAELISYTKNHFSNEERLMSSNGYAGYEEHRKSHEALTRQVVDFENKLKRGDATLTISLMSFLKRWLTDHIQGVDKKYSAFFNGKGIR